MYFWVMIPLLTNLLLDRPDKELEKRGHKFVRYADDCNIYVKSKHAGERVLASVIRFLSRKLKLKVNAQKSAVDRPWRRKFLGFTVTHSGPHRRKVSEKALERFKEVIRHQTRRAHRDDGDGDHEGWQGQEGIGDLHAHTVGTASKHGAEKPAWEFLPCGPPP